MASSRPAIEPLNIREVPGGFPDLPDLEGIRLLWQGRVREGLLPARRDFAVADLRPWIGHVSLLDVRDDGRFRWRLIGTRIAEVVGRDATGSWLEDLYGGETLADFRRIYAKVVERRLPVHYCGDLHFAGKGFIQFRAVVMPLSDDGAKVNMLMLCLHFDL